MTSPEPFPNLFLAGAPKCGTSSMHQYLAEHPEIFMSAHKEPNFFTKRFQTYNQIKDRNAYLNLFQDAEDHDVVGEASTWYIHSPLAPHRIQKASPDARIILMLRKPVDMMHSLHSQMIRSHYETIPDFQEALEAEEARRRRVERGEEGRWERLLLYRDTARYARKIERYFEVFGKENVHIIFFHDFKEDPARVYRDTLEFLGVDPTFRPEFPVVNPNQSLRSTRLRDFLRDPPPAVKAVSRALFPDAVRDRVIGRLHNLNRKTAPREPLPLELREQLVEELREDMDQVRQLTGRNLDHWYQV